MSCSDWGLALFIVVAVMTVNALALDAALAYFHQRTITQWANEKRARVVFLLALVALGLVGLAVHLLC